MCYLEYTLSTRTRYQGETDGMHEEMANTYKDRLIAFITDTRAALGSPELPVLVVKIETRCYDRILYLAEVQRAQAAVCSEMDGVYFIEATDPQRLEFFEDNLHLQTEGYVNIARQMAKVAVTNQVL
jgi:lysophospholipase L1-like esterase